MNEQSTNTTPVEGGSGQRMGKFVGLGCLGCLGVVVVAVVVGVIAFLRYQEVPEEVRQMIEEREQSFEKAYEAARQALDGKPAPDFSTTTLAGEPWRLSEQQGKVIVLDFWASWCGPCIDAMPDLVELEADFGHRSDFELVGVALDEERTDTEESMEENDITWLQLFEEGSGWENEIATLYQVKGIPFVLVIDQEGIVRGFDPPSSMIAEAVRDLLATDTARNEPSERLPMGASPD